MINAVSCSELLELFNGNFLMLSRDERNSDVLTVKKYQIPEGHLAAVGWNNFEALNINIKVHQINQLQIGKKKNAGVLHKEYQM